MAKNGCSVGQSSRKSALSNLKKDLDALDRGEHPTALGVMGILSTLSEAMSPSTSEDDTVAKLLAEMSEKKCRFCD